jgi:polyferredoxin
MEPLSKSRHRIFLLIRRFSQLLFLGTFVFLFLNTDYSGSDELEYVVNILFRLDPFLAAVTMLAGRTIIALMLPSLVVLLLTVILGRSFCGWFCPLGTLLDGFRYVTPTDKKGIQTLYPRLGRILLFTTLILALLGFHIAGYLDPFSILVRGLAQTVYPAFHGLTQNFFSFTYSSAPDFINAVTEPIYSLMKDYILPAERKFFELVYLSFAVLLLVFILEIMQKRFFCRNICPLGAMLGMLSCRSLIKTQGGDETCGKCRVCAKLCRMGAIDSSRAIDMSNCNLCIECAVKCPRQIISFGTTRVAQSQPTHLGRRRFLTVLAAGVVLPAVKGADVLARKENPLLIRPPGALGEKEFLGRCVRCAECLQVCIGNALQPTLLEGGIDGLFTPKLVARSGYCEFNCTLCGQVCPTGAIRKLSQDEKHVLKIGNAWFDKDRCLPWAKGVPCMVCEEHCPTPQKAIRFQSAKTVNTDGELVFVKQPYIIDDLCIGCGICEFKCPLPGRSAVLVTSANEDRDPRKKLPDPATVSAANPYG